MLKAVLFDFNGVIINDEPIHEKLLKQLLVEENSRLTPGEFRQVCLGRSDRACITDLLTRRGRMVSESYLATLLERKANAYRRELELLEKLPIYPGLDDLMFHLHVAQIKLAIVSGAMRSDIDLVLGRANLSQAFPVIVSTEDGTPSKPEPDSYLLAIERLNHHYPGLNLHPDECLAIEDTFAGIESAKRAGIPVVGIANTYPFHMMQRRANWAVDYLLDLELDRIRQRFEQSVA